MKNLYKILAVLLLIPTFAFIKIATEKHEESKTIKKTFTVDKNATVRLKNKYGNLNITTWNKNKVEINVKITVEGNDEDNVKNTLDDISVQFDASNNFVDAETLIDRQKSNWNWWGKSKKVNYKINYTVKMPESNNIELNNKYGNIYLDKILGKATVDCDYGKINIGELRNEKNYINLDYCSTSTIGFAERVDVNIDYSKLTIDASENIDLNADYSKFTGGTIKEIDFNTDYGSIKIDDVSDIKGNGDYTGIKIEKLRKKLDIDTDYGSVSVDELVDGFDEVNITANYAGIKLGADKNNSFTFIVDLQYGSFKRDNDVISLNKSEVKSTKKYYEGSFGKSKSTSKVKIRSKYGSVSIKEN